MIGTGVMAGDGSPAGGVISGGGVITRSRKGNGVQKEKNKFIMIISFQNYNCSTTPARQEAALRHRENNRAQRLVKKPPAKAGFSLAEAVTFFCRTAYRENSQASNNHTASSNNKRKRNNVVRETVTRR
ncbi:MAG: hypothetical protein J6J42_13705 [Lachnospiraceae bacterium]|nr:hypothetical protein [Lachnospiraceae bacterium]